MELARDRATDIEYWPTHDPTLADGSRDAMLAAYREVRDAAGHGDSTTFRRAIDVRG